MTGIAPSGHALGSDFSIGVQVQLTSRNSLTRLSDTETVQWSLETGTYKTTRGRKITLWTLITSVQCVRLSSLSTALLFKRRHLAIHLHDIDTNNNGRFVNLKLECKMDMTLW